MGLYGVEGEVKLAGDFFIALAMKAELVDFTEGIGKVFGPHSNASGPRPHHRTLVLVMRSALRQSSGPVRSDPNDSQSLTQESREKQRLRQ